MEGPSAPRDPMMDKSAREAAIKEAFESFEPSKLDIKKLDQEERKVLLTVFKILKGEDVAPTTEIKVRKMVQTMKNVGERLSEISKEDERSSFVKAFSNIFGGRISPQAVMKAYNKLPIEIKDRKKVSGSSRSGFIAELTPARRKEVIAKFKNEKLYLEERKRNISSFRDEIKKLNELNSYKLMDRNKMNEIARGLLTKSEQKQSSSPHADHIENKGQLSKQLTAIVKERENAIKDLIDEVTHVLAGDPDYRIEGKPSKQIAEEKIEFLTKLCDNYEKDLNYFMKQDDATLALLEKADPDAKA